MQLIPTRTCGSVVCHTRGVATPEKKTRHSLSPSGDTSKETGNNVRSVIAVHNKRRQIHNFANNGYPVNTSPSMSSVPQPERVSFQNPKGETLVGIVTHALPCSSNTIPQNSAIVMCHGYTSNKNSCRFKQIATALAHAGFTTLRFDHPCAVYGESERHGEFRMGNHGDEVDDIASAVQYLTKDKQMHVIGLIGHSKGGTNVITYSAEIGDVPLVVNLAGRFQPRCGLEKRFGAGILEKLERDGPITRNESWGTWVMRYDDVQERVNLPMEAYAARIKEDGRVRMLCLHGRDDATIDCKESEKCAEIAGCEVRVIPGDHNFTDERDGLGMVQEIVQFFCTSI
jgi:alpha/beta superfamily hydrolase